MTHRRLFLRLFICSTLLLASVWGISTVRCFGIEITPVSYGYTIGCDFYPGTVELSLRKWPNEQEPLSYSYSADPEDLRAMRMALGVMGEFRLETCGPPVWLPYYIVSFPIWLPYLFLVGGAFGLLKWPERRDKDAEGKLAEHGKKHPDPRI